MSYDANGGTGAPAAQTKTHGTALTLSSTKPTRTGYTFLGWYADGQLLSTEREMQLSDGIRVTACFAGDVNEDGAINMADALLIMRCATELGGELPLRLADADRNGSIGIPDALLAARVAMGN